MRKEPVANTFVMKCLKELNIYSSFIKAVKEQHKGDYDFIQKIIFGAEGQNTIDYGITWIHHPEVHWVNYHEELRTLCKEHREEYERGWIYKNS